MIKNGNVKKKSSALNGVVIHNLSDPIDIKDTFKKYGFFLLEDTVYLFSNTTGSFDYFNDFDSYLEKGELMMGVLSEIENKATLLPTDRDVIMSLYMKARCQNV